MGSVKHRAYIQSLARTSYLEVVREGLDFIQLHKLVKPDTRVFIKPNLTYPTFRPGVMTSPEAVEAAILALREYTANIYIGDSDSGGYNRFSMDQVYNETGLRGFADKYQVEVINLSKLERRTIHFYYEGKEFSLGLPRLLTDEIDLLVTMPVPKVHVNTGVSLTLKNQWGCIPENEDRLKLHPYLPGILLEVNKAVNAKVAIIDGRYGLNLNGPMNGIPVELDWLLVTDDIGAGAMLGCKLMQIDPDDIRHLRYARQQGYIPEMDDILLNQDLQPFIKDKFVLHRKLTDYPGFLAFHNPMLAWLAYFSPLSDLLHRVLYLFREPLYDYKKYAGR